jgi:excisionase family DNA binding protein
MSEWLRASAWLPPGLALAWLATLATLVHNFGIMLADWGTTLVLAVLAGLLAQRRNAPSGISPSGTARTGPAASPEAVTHAPPQAPHTAAQTDAAADANQSGQEGASSSAARPTSAVSQEALPSVGFDRTHTSKPKSSGLEVVELRVLTAEEVASVLRVDTALIITSITTGELPGNRIGGHWRIDQGALTRWLQGPYAERPGGDDSHLSLPRPSSLMTTVAAESTSQLEDSAESDGRAHDRS